MQSSGKQSDVVAQMLQLLMDDEERQRAKKERSEKRIRELEATERRDRARLEERKEELVAAEKHEQAREIKAARDREQQEAFLKDFSDWQAIKSDKLQQASKTARQVFIIPAMIAGEDVEAYLENFEKLLTQIEVPKP